METNTMLTMHRETMNAAYDGIRWDDASTELAQHSVTSMKGLWASGK